MSKLIRSSALGVVMVGHLLALAAPARPDDDGDGDDWPMFGHDPLGTRYNTGEKRLGPANVAGPRVLWQYQTPAIVAGTPAVVGDTVFDGDAAGNFYALDAATGGLRWKTAIAGAAFTGFRSQRIPLANSRRRPISRSLGELGTLEGGNSAPRTTRTISPTVSATEKKTTIFPGDGSLKRSFGSGVRRRSSLLQSLRPSATRL